MRHGEQSPREAVFEAMGLDEITQAGVDRPDEVVGTVEVMRMSWASLRLSRAPIPSAFSVSGLPECLVLDPVSIYLPVVFGHLGAQKPQTPLCSRGTCSFDHEHGGGQQEGVCVCGGWVGGARVGSDLTAAQT